MFGRDVFVFELLRFLCRAVQEVVHLAPEARFSAAVHFGSCVERGRDGVAKLVDVDADLAEDDRGRALCVVEQRGEQVFGVDLSGVAFAGDPLRLDERFLCLAREFVEVRHRTPLR